MIVEDEDRAGGLPRDALCDRAQNEAMNAGPTVRPHDDEIAARLARVPENLRRWVTREQPRTDGAARAFFRVRAPTRERLFLMLELGVRSRR